MKMKQKHCNDIFKYICDNLDQDLNSVECKEIKRHLESCPYCFTYLDSLKKTIILYRKYPDPKIPELIHKNILSKIKPAKARI